MIADPKVYLKMILIIGGLSSRVTTRHLWWALRRAFTCNLCRFTRQWRPIKLTNDCLDASNSEVSGSSATCARLKHRIQIYDGSQTASNCNEMVQNRWLRNKHTHTQSHRIIILRRHPVCKKHRFWKTPEAPQLLDKAQYGPMSKLTKNLKKHLQNLMMQAITAS